MTMMGGYGLQAATESAILAANYVAKRLATAYPVLYSGPGGLVAHECILDLRPLKETSDVAVDDVAKRLMMSNPLATPSAAQVERGVAVVTAEDNRWRRCDLKTISLVGNVLMRQLAADADAIETVMFRDGWLTEASASNVLIVTGGVIVAPPRDNLILPGITYDAAEEFARYAGFPFEMRPVAKSEALAADEMWLSSSTKEVLAVTRLDGAPFAGGAPGPMFKKLHAIFQQRKRGA